MKIVLRASGRPGPRLLLARLLLALSLAWLLPTVAAAQAHPVDAHTVSPPATSPAPSPTPVFPYADTSHVDFRFLRDARALHRGFLRVGPDGHFQWEDGGRARFWGINIANRNLWIPRPEIDAVVECIARSGANLVRFEALDSRGGLLEIAGRPGSRAIDPVKLDTLHYWIARLRDHRIHYYLDLVDFREFAAEDGVDAPEKLGRAARPYLVFDPRLIALQKEYAGQLLTTPNPYTGLRPVDDPALVLLELFNETGFFINPSAVDNLAEPYRGRLQARWNAFLAEHVGDRAALAARWGAQGRNLLPDEDPAKGTVRLPTLVLNGGNNGNGDARRSPTRFRDGVWFLYTVQRAYFKEMRDHLRSLGLRIPVTAVVSNDVAPDLASVAAECDFLSENAYADHPRFAGKDWEGAFLHDNRNPLRDTGPRGFAPYTACLRWEGKPVVVREWATVWPNRYRSGSVPEAAAYGRLQDFDALILFGYKTGDVGDRLVEFGYQVDPPVWGLFGVGATIFLRGDVRPPDAALNLVHTPATLFSTTTGVNELHRLAWMVRLNTTVREASGAPSDLAGGSRGEGPFMYATAPVAGIPHGLGHEPEALRKMLETGVLVAANGSIVRRSRDGLLEIHGPRVAVLAGELPSDHPVGAGSLSVQSASPVGTVVALSLDGLPLSRSRRYLVKMVTVAENTGQRLARTPPGAPADYVLADRGGPPVLTQGRTSNECTRVRLHERPLVSIWLENGSWELLVDGDRTLFWCDTPGVVAEVQGRRFVTSAAWRELR